ncbi:MAG: zinc ribbon domain-containing protein, partial [Bacilli bacterium]|nr:zinc ribbon domain-containing protein [Bacilli bacterium]
MEKEEVITMVECPNCHQELSSINKFCTRCGAVLDASVAKGPSYQQPEPGVVMYTCPKCQNVYNMSNKFCPKCGNPTNPDDENAIIEEQPQKVMSIMFEPGVELPEDQMLDRFIKNQMAVLGIENGTKLIPISVLRRKKIMNIIISILVFVYVSMIFIHFPLATYIVGLIILIICLKSFNRYDFMKYLIKQIKARPNEKISNIIMNETNDLVVDNSGFIKAIGMILAVILPCVIFFKPVIIYEKMDG